jgi:hypothetical protein
MSGFRAHLQFCRDRFGVRAINWKLFVAENATESY